MKEEIAPKPAEGEEEEIDLLELGLKLWNSRKRILVWALCGAVAGLIVALSIPKEYTSSVKLVSETGEASSGGAMSSLAAMAGINIGNKSGGDALAPEMYPEIVSSTPFIVELFPVKLPTDVEGDTVSVEEMISERVTSPWWTFLTSLPGRAIGLFTGGRNEDADGGGGVNPFHLTRDQKEIADGISGRVSADVSKDGIITISVTLQDAIASANLADTVARRLQEYIKNYRTGKARNDLEYAEKLNEEAKGDYFKAQQEYAMSVDRNQGLSNRTAALEQERLQNEMQLAFNLYNSTSQQVQLAKAKVQSTTPVFSVIEPSSVPNMPSKPKKVLIIAGFIFLAVVCCSAVILFAPGLKQSIKEKQNQNK